MIDLIYKLLGIRRAWLKDQQGAIRAYRLRTDPFGDYVTMRSTAGRFRVSLLPDGTTDNATYPEWRP